jgi:hypothetical protein
VEKLENGNVLVKNTLFIEFEDTTDDMQYDFMVVPIEVDLEINITFSEQSDRMYF